MAFPGSIYAPPGTYTQTFFETPVQGLAASVRIPLILGTGSEILSQLSLEVVRGSSSSVDQKVVQEDETGRAVSAISAAGRITLSSFNGALNRVRVKNYPIVTGNGSGTTATNAASINVTVNGSPVVVLAVDGTRGIITLSVTPESTDEVKVTYFFNRTDTLITDDLSDQITSTAPILYGAIGESYEIYEDVNDTLSFTVDSEDTVSVTISESPTGGWSAAQITAFINSAASSTSLVASTAINNFGQTVLALTADRDILVGSGTANSTFGFTSGSSTSRRIVFYTFQRPIVDGSNGGVTTTDPADVTVKVNGTQVIPTAVDGQTGAVTLPFAPEVGATVTCQYYFNSWQDTFDYLAHRNLLEITQCGLTPDRNDYVDGSDFILKDDLILWGTAFLVESGEHTSGYTLFNGTQVTGTLVDIRQYLAECTPVVNSSVNPPVENRKDFTLPLQPTTGNGRDTPISSTTYKSVANGRIDLPTNRPDLIFAYWGFSLSDAVERGRVDVTVVDSDTSQITLAQPVPVGAKVYATFYYNTIIDQEYTLAVESIGPSGVGTYAITNEDGTVLLTPKFGAKSAGLATITLQFPSGSERTPDCRFEAPFTTTDYDTSVEEDVTVEFASLDATLAKFTVPGSGPYYVISGSSDHFDLQVDGSSLTGGFVDLSDPLGVGSGFSAQFVGSEVSYDAASGGTTYEIDSTNNTIELQVDGILIQGIANAGAAQNLSDYVEAINRASFGEFSAATAGGAATITLAASASDQDDYYVGWTVKVTSGAAAGDTRTVSDYDGDTKVATVSVAFTAAPGAADTYQIFNPDVLPYITGASRFLASVRIAAGMYDELRLSYTGSVSGQQTLTLNGANVIPAGTYASASSLAAAVQISMDAAIAAAGYDFAVTVSSDTSGRLTFALELDPSDVEGGYLEFVDGASAPVDFAVLAGLDTDAAQSGQAKILNMPIARRYTFVGGGPLYYDRLVLRNRLVPGRDGSMDGEFVKGLCQLSVLGGTGSELCGLTSGPEGLAGVRGTVMEPTLVSLVGFSGGQVPAATYGTASDGQPVVTLYASGGTTSQNNVLKFTFEGTPITVTFTDAVGVAIASGGSADVPLGPVSGVAQTTVLSQIAASMAAAGVAGSIVQEGAGFRFRGASSAASASIEIGTGSANDVLGLSDGDVVQRETLVAATLVSALMAQADGTLSDSLFSWEGASGYFAGEAHASVVTDEANAEYLFLQSQGNAGAGTSSSLTIDEAGTSSVTRPGTGLGISDGDGSSGEDAIDGFFVTSSDTENGSGTVNSSVLNAGMGQDGYVGQTYRDLVTGFTFTLLPREGGGSYPSGETFTFTVRRVVTTDSNLPINTIPGVEVIVSNTSGIAVGDTCLVSTYEKGGNQPSVGDVYYVSYNYTKADYSPSLFTKMASIEAAYGSNGTENPATLASYLAIINGAVLVAVKQVQKDTDTDSDGENDAASEQAFLDAIDEVAGVLPGGAYPDILVPLKGDSLALFQYLAKHCDIQSSIRYRAERTGIVGLAAGTQPRDAGSTAQAVGRFRVRVVYPDIYTLSLDNSDGSTDTFLVDGTYMAAALAGNRSSPTIDVATPWTGAKIFGFDEIARTLDAVQQNQIAVRGVTIMDSQRTTIKVRQGLTTDMSSVLTKLPTVATIADEVQRQTRSALERFIGTKFIAGVTSQIEQQVTVTMKQLKAAQIIAAYTGISAKVSEDDPTTAEVEAYYQPVFPLLYIIVTFNLRASL